MTLVNFIIAKEAVYLVADTQISDPTDMRPLTFTNKVCLLPHWQCLMFGTGIGPFVLEWQHILLSSMLAKDIVHLNQYTPDGLQRIFSKYRDLPELRNRVATSTIYHLGYDEEKDSFTGFAYRSTNNFVSEKLNEGFYLKPDPEENVDFVQKFPIDYVPIAQLQKDRDEKKQINERVGIGGHLISYMMQKVDDGNGGAVVQTITSRFHEFDDFSKAYRDAASKLSSL